MNGTGNKVAIITGSDSGIGKATAAALARDGFDIGITWHEDEAGAKRTADEVRGHGRRAEVRRLDLARLPGAAHGGRIVNITSVHEHTPLSESTAYTAASTGSAGSPSRSRWGSRSSSTGVSCS